MPIHAAKVTEESIQKTVFDALRKCGAKSLLAWHPKNGGPHQMTIGQRINNHKLGVLSGIADVHILHKGQFYCLELKTLEGKESAGQQWIRAAMTEAGADCHVAYGIDDALAYLRFQGLLR